MVVFGRLKKGLAFLLIFCLALSSVGVVSRGAAASALADLKGHWAEKQMTDWMERGLIEGFADGTFKPDNAVNRGEFIALINRAFGFEETAAVAFSDITAADWAYEEVAKAVKAGYIEGYADGTIGIGHPVSRQEAAVMTARVLKLDMQADRKAAQRFTDADVIAEWAAGAVGALVAKRIMEGYEDGSYQPGSRMTRAETVVVLDRAADLTHGEGSASPLPSASPSATPATEQTPVPTSTSAPTSAPTAAPTQAPTSTPTATPTQAPTSTPTATPTSTPTSTPAEEETGTVTGIVYGAGQAPVGGAAVTVTGTTYKTVTDSSGTFTIGQVPPGIYTITAEKDGHTNGVSAAFEVAAGSAVWVTATLSPNVFVENGMPKAVIVVPDASIGVEDYAASELQYHILKSTQATLQIVKESSALPEGLLPVYIGRTQAALNAGLDGGAMGPRSYAIRTTPNGIYITGHDEAGSSLDLSKDAGTLFGVYDILRNDLGAKWLWPGELGEEIPQNPSFSINHRDLMEQAQLQHTRWRNVSLVADVDGVAPSVKAQFMQDQSVWLRRHGFAEGISLNYGHGFTNYWDRFKDTHPEYFNLLPDNTRRPSHPYYPGVGSLISMNVGNEGLQDQVISEWLANRTDKKGWVNGIENDTPGLDRSPETLALDNTSVPYPVPEGKEDLYLPYSLSDRYAKWFLALQEKARVYDPNAKVIGYAYENYSAPPVDTQLNRDIVIGIVPTHLFPWTDENSQSFKEQWGGWYEKGASLYLRPNYTLAGHNLPIQYAEAFGDDFDFAYSRGMIGTDFDSLTGMFAAQGPSLYMVARMHDTDGIGVQSILDEYYGAFGPAEQHVKQYFDFWGTVTERAEQAFLGLDISKMHVDSVFADFHRVIDLLFTASDFTAAHAILDEAKGVAAGDAKVLQRIEFLEKGLIDAELAVQMMAANRLAQSDPAKEIDLIAAVQRLDSYRQSIASSNAVNIWYAAWAENRTINRTLYQEYKKYDLLAKLPAQWEFKWDPEETGETNQWYSEASSETWDTIGIDSVWEQQPNGIAWKNEHGSDYDGVAWYRTTFDAEELKDNLALLFGAVDKSSKVWVNGIPAGENIYDPVTSPNAWKDPFTIPLDQAARPGSNTVVVRVESRSGVGGIYKPVWLVRQTRSAPISLADWSVTPAEAAVSPLSPVTATSFDGFDLFINPEASASGTIELVLDAGSPALVTALAFKNRPTATNLSIRNMQVWVGSGDDGVHFDEMVYNGTVPGTNAAGEMRTVDIADSAKRYYKLVVTSNFFGAINGGNSNLDRIQVAKFYSIAAPPVSVISPTEKASYNGFVMYTNPNASVSGSVELRIDLGTAQMVADLLVKNRPLATNLSVKAAKIFVGTDDDGVVFDKEIFNGAIPGTITADAVRSIMIPEVHKRYFKVVITDNFFGPINGNPNQNGVQLAEFLYVKKLE